MQLAENQQLLTSSDLAALLGLREASIRQLRFRGEGPRFVKVTGRVLRYRKTDVDEWLESRLSQKQKIR